MELSFQLQLHMALHFEFGSDTVMPRLDDLARYTTVSNWASNTTMVDPLGPSLTNIQKAFWVRIGTKSMGNDVDEIMLAVFFAEPEFMPELQDRFFSYYLEEGGKQMDECYSDQQIHEIEDQLIGRAARLSGMLKQYDQTLDQLMDEL